jgi:molybdenum cofactor cytidylyltransferase
MKRTIDCIMLAAGESQRMGGWKLSLLLDGKPLIERSVEGALEACGRVILVTGYRAEDLERLFSGNERVVLVRNPEYRSGMFSSIRAGAEEVRTERFFIALGDMPLVEKEVYNALLGHEGAPAVIPKYRGKKGHPLLLKREVRDIILRLGPEKTMRDALALVATLAVPVQSRNVLLDIDEREDYEKLVDR